jgi:hypothetical protein
MKTVFHCSKYIKALNEDMTLLRPEKEVKEMYSAALLKENSSKNRSFSVLPRKFILSDIYVYLFQKRR